MVCWDDFPQRHIDSFDDTDVGPKKPYETISYTYFDAAVVLLSIISFIGDTFMDSYVAYIHYVSGHTIYFVLTVIFVALPMLTMTAFSLRWYLIDAKDPNAPATTSCQWRIRTVCLLLQQGPVMRYIDSLMYGIKSRNKKYGRQRQKRYYQEMLYEDVDATLLRLFECFMESAPQLLLQISILANTIRKDFHYLHTMACHVIIASTFMSLMSFSWAVSAYFRSLRFALPNKDNMNWQTTIVYTLWRFFTIGARMLAMGLFVSSFPQYLFIFCTVHWLLMTVWIIRMKTEFCPKRYEEVLYNGVVGVIFIFCYFNPVDTPTRFRCTVYYIVTLTENTALLLIWYIYDGSVYQFSYVLLIVHYVSFVVGLWFMMIYYLYLHPTQAIKVWSTSKAINTMHCTDSSDHSTKGVRLRSIRE